MVEISNNLLAGLLIVAIVISGSSFLVIAGMGPVTLTGGYFKYGTANVTISGQLIIEIVRNVTDFGSSTLDGDMRIVSSQQENNWTGGGTFNNGSEGNGTDYGPGTNAYPFVIKNEGNMNASINLSTKAGEADSWIGGGGGAGSYFKAKNNLSAACGADLGAGFGEGSWTDLNVSETVACSDLDFGPTADELRLHFRLQIPTAAVGTKGTIVDIGAISS